MSVRVFNRTGCENNRLYNSNNSLLNLKVITIMLVFTFLWNSQLTQTSKGLIDTAKKTWESMDKLFTDELTSSSVRAAIWNRQSQFATQDVVNYTIETTKEYQSSKPYIVKFDKDKYSNYIAGPAYSKSIPYGKYIDTRILYLYPYIALFLKISIPIGLIYLLIHRKGKNIVATEYKFMCLISLALITLFMVLPYISLSYNFERIIQQSLIVLALPMILGIYFTLTIIFIRKEKYKFLFSLVIILIYFIYPSGLINQFAGGTGYLHLNNFGEFYSRYYFHESEHSSLQWLSNHYNTKFIIYADKYAKLKFISFSNITQNIITDLLPSAIDKNAYVYSSYANTVDKITYTNFNHRELSYNYPHQFLAENKNKIYSNLSSEIFK